MYGMSEKARELEAKGNIIRKRINILEEYKETNNSFPELANYFINLEESGIKKKLRGLVARVVFNGLGIDSLQIGTCLGFICTVNPVEDNYLRESIDSLVDDKILKAKEPTESERRLTDKESYWLVGRTYSFA